VISAPMIGGSGDTNVKSRRRRDSLFSRGSKRARIGACTWNSRSEVENLVPLFTRSNRGRRRHMMALGADNLWYVPYILYNLAAKRDVNAAQRVRIHRENPRKRYDMRSTARFFTPSPDRQSASAPRRSDQAWRKDAPRAAYRRCGAAAAAVFRRKARWRGEVQDKLLFAPFLLWRSFAQLEVETKHFEAMKRLPFHHASLHARCDQHHGARAMYSDASCKM
jgi:hypothetical protein